MKRSQQGSVGVNLGSIFYEVDGPVDPAGRGIALIHAGIADYRMWDAQFPVFTERYRVVRYDQRGFGHSTTPKGEYAFRWDLDAVLRTMHIERAHLIGTSLGGGVALDYALTYPEKVASLVLVGSALGGSEPSDYLRERWKQMGEAFERDGLDAVNELELRLWVDGQGRSRMAESTCSGERVREMNRGVLEREEENDAKGVLNRLDPAAIDRLGEIAVPTLVIVGDRDVPDILANADRLVAGIAGARKVVLPDVAHLPPMERPDEFNRLVLDFLGAR
jgi:pimeloyl-ACP methyl ester carboxylesterase